MEPLLHRQFMTSARYAAWANERLHQAVAAVFADEDEELPYSDVHRLVGVLNGLLVAGRFWFAVLRGYDPGVASLDERLYEDAEEIREAQIADDVALCDYVHGLAEEDMLRPISYQALDGVPHANAQQELLVELFARQIHFRGRICERLSVLGAEQPELDYLEFLRETAR